MKARLLRLLAAALLAASGGLTHGAPLSDEVHLLVISPTGGPALEIPVLVVDEATEGAVLTVDLGPILAGILPGFLLPASPFAAYLAEPGSNVISDAIAVLNDNRIAFLSDPPTEEDLPFLCALGVGGPIPIPAGGVFPSGPCLAETGAFQDVTGDLFGPLAAQLPVRILVRSDVDATAPEPATLLLLAGGLLGLGLSRRKIA